MNETFTKTFKWKNVKYVIQPCFVSRLAILGPLNFHINFKVRLSRPGKAADILPSPLFLMCVGGDMHRCGDQDHLRESALPVYPVASWDGV